MDKLLIIGAGIGQVPLLKMAKEQGINVTVATIPGDYPCIKLADDVIYKDIYDRDGIVEDAKKRQITAVVSDQNDLMMPTVAYVAEKLGLCGNKFETVMSYCNKNCFRDICEKVNVPTPKHINVDCLDFDISKLDCTLPWIIKPADSQSSIGVTKINNVDEIKPALQTALTKSHTHTAIIEEFFCGREVVCEGFVFDGKYYNLSFGDREYFDLENLFIPSQTIFPSRIDISFLDRIVEYEQRIAAHTKPSFAIVHSEYLVNEETGSIRVVESALRGGGEYISSDIIPLSTGIDVTDLVLKCALGYKPDVENLFRSKTRKAAGYICFSLPEGVVQSVSGIDEVRGFHFVEHAYLDDIIVGTRTQKMTYKGARKGPIIVYGSERDELCHFISQIQQTLHIKVRTMDGSIKDIIWN